MSTLYKLTNHLGQTYNKTQWGENISHSGTGKGNLCGPGYIHAYLSPELAVLLNPIHADFIKYLLWEATGDIIKNNKDLKVGCVTLTTIKQISIPNITLEQRVYFAILCSKSVYFNETYIQWANNWINNIDRTAAAARTAAYAAAPRTAAARAANAAIHAAAAANAANAANTAAYAADYAAYAAAYAADYAAADLNLISLAKLAVEF